MKKIAILLPDLSPGGAERVTLRLASWFIRLGYEVDLLLMKARGHLLGHVPQEVRIIDFSVSRIRGVIVPLRQYLKAERPLALLVAMYPLTVIAMLAALTIRRRPRIVVCEHVVLSRMESEVRLPGSSLMRSILRWTYLRAGGIVAVSKGVAQDLSRLADIPAPRIRVIYNPAARGQAPSTDVMTTVFNDWKNYGYSKIITVGTLKRQKNHKLLLTAFSQVRQAIPAKLLILGEGKTRPELENLACELGISSDVLMPGFAADTYPYYLASDLFVLSSCYEGFGNVIVEAMECGLPVVSTDCESGPAEILDGGRYGWLVPVGDAHALASAMLVALKEPTNPERQRARAREFSIERAGEAYLELLDPARLSEPVPYAQPKEVR